MNLVTNRSTAKQSTNMRWRERWSGRGLKQGVIGAALALGLVGGAAVVPSAIAPRSASASALPEGAVFVPSAPQRLFDTRDGTGFGGVAGTIAADSTVSVQITGAVVPVGAVGVAMNLTYAEAQGTGYITVYPDDAALPGTSNLNKVGAGPVANYVTVRLSSSGRLAIYNNGGPTHLVGDVLGYYVPGSGAPGPAGPQGAQGAQGPAGPQGEPGLTGYEIVSTHLASSESGEATCPDGKRVLGGSFVWDYPDPHGAVPSGPNPDGTGWTADASYGFGSGGTLYAICATVHD
ncbi:MAG: hypothetical protein AB7L17_00600 [Ilumatobacteraceae bacterium]